MSGVGGVEGAREGPLPKGWAWSTVEKIAVEVRSGFASGKHNAAGEGIPHLRPMNVSRKGDVDLADTKYVAPDVDSRRIQVGDVIFNNTNSPALVGKTAVMGVIGEFAFSNHMTRIRVAPGMHPKFVGYQLHQLWMSGALAHLIKNHVNQASIASKVLAAQVELVVAPCAEQERIVASIEEHLYRLDAAEAALARCRRKLKHLLRSVLETSCVGTWTTQPLRDVTRSIRNGVFVSRPGVAPPGDRIFRISAVRPLDLRIDDIRYADPVPEKAERYRVTPGDLLFTRYSGNPDYVGAAAVVPKAGAGILHPDKLIRVVADTDRALPDWIAAYLSVGEGRRQVEARLKTTAGQVGISGSQLGTVPISIPPLSHQREMVGRIATVRAAQRDVEDELVQAEERGRSLRQSILAAAFSGRLVAQDPEDASADALLARIAAERPQPRARRTKKQETSR